MPTERVIEIPWCLQEIPQSGRILDVGSCEATYLRVVQQADRELHCLDPRDGARDVPPGAVFHHQSLIGNTLPRRWFDAVLLVSVLEHVGLPCYGQEPFPGGDARALEEIWELLRPGAPALLTVPAGPSRVTTWYRQYGPSDLHRLLADWRHEIRYWGFDGSEYRPVAEEDVERYDYRDRHDDRAGAGALAAIRAWRD
jgi:SAM-dependent methyltransferase